MISEFNDIPDDEYVVLPYSNVTNPDDQPTFEYE